LIKSRIFSRFIMSFQDFQAILILRNFNIFFRILEIFKIWKDFQDIEIDIEYCMIELLESLWN